VPNNSTNCVNGTTIGVLSGNTTTVGYDTATGLGSVNAANLVNTWSTQSGTPTIAVTLSPTTLPAGNVGTQYYQQITAGGGTLPYTYTLTSGTLPAGCFSRRAVCWAERRPPRDPPPSPSRLATAPF
jgi:hypothetical protein